MAKTRESAESTCYKSFLELDTYSIFRSENLQWTDVSILIVTQCDLPPPHFGTSYAPAYDICSCVNRYENLKTSQIFIIQRQQLIQVPGYTQFKLKVDVKNVKGGILFWWCNIKYSQSILRCVLMRSISYCTISWSRQSWPVLSASFYYMSY